MYVHMNFIIFPCVVNICYELKYLSDTIMEERGKGSALTWPAQIKCLNHCIIGSTIELTHSHNSQYNKTFPVD